jgi:hypothetical protein
MNQLLLLPCNGGAKTGDYLLPNNPLQGALWKHFYKRLNGKVDFASVDSIITFLHDDGLGALVLYPQEMDRVKGYSIEATLEMYNPLKPSGLRRLEKHTECLKVGIERVFPKYDRVLVAVNVEAYKLCLFAAITETNMWMKTLFYDTLAAAFNTTKVCQEVEKDLDNLSMVGIKEIAPRESIDQKYITKWTKYRDNIPSRWCYWE